MAAEGVGYGDGGAGAGMLLSMVTTCGTCRKTIDVKPYRVRRAKTGLVFCSQRCQRANPAVLEANVASTRTRAERTCPQCGATFTRIPAELRPVNYCSVSCSAKANMTLRPIPKGERRARSTEFRPGQRPGNYLPVGTVRIRKRPRRDDRRAWVKVADPNVWRPRAVVEYERAYGPVPVGKVVHHIDEDQLNDDPANLSALTRSEHLAVHRSTP